MPRPKTITAGVLDLSAQTLVKTYGENPHRPPTMAFLKRAVAKAGGTHATYTQALKDIYAQGLMGVARQYPGYPYYNNACLTLKGERLADELLGRKTAKVEDAAMLALLTFSAQGGVWENDLLPGVGPLRASALFAKAQRTGLITLGNGARFDETFGLKQAYNAGLLTAKGQQQLQAYQSKAKPL